MMKRHGKRTRWDSGPCQQNAFRSNCHQNTAQQGDNFNAYPRVWSPFHDDRFPYFQNNALDRMFEDAYHSDRNNRSSYNTGNFNQGPYRNDLSHRGGGFQRSWNNNPEMFQDWNAGASYHDNDGIRGADCSKIGNSSKEQFTKGLKETDRLKESKDSRMKSSKISQTDRKNPESTSVSCGDETFKYQDVKRNQSSSQEVNRRTDYGNYEAKALRPNNPQWDQSSNAVSQRDSQRNFPVSGGSGWAQRFDKESNKNVFNKQSLLGASPTFNRKTQSPIDPSSKFSFSAGKEFNRWGRDHRGFRFNQDAYESDESNEINNWLQQSRGKEHSNEKYVSSSTEPLPGSEEARTNAIKEQTDRLKQALKLKKTVNPIVSLNELLSSGDESKNENHAPTKMKTFPKNLANLELDASDMRAIGRANTEKSNLPVDESSDDDVIEVLPPPPPPRNIVEIDDSPKKDEARRALLESSESEDEAPLTKSMDGNCMRNVSVDRSSSEGKSFSKVAFSNLSVCSTKDVEIDSNNQKIDTNETEDLCTEIERRVPKVNVLQTDSSSKSNSTEAMSSSKANIMETFSANNPSNPQLSYERDLPESTNQVTHGTDMNNSSSLDSREEIEPSLARVISQRRTSVDSRLPTGSRTSPNYSGVTPSANQRRRRVSSSSSCPASSPRSSQSAPLNSPQQIRAVHDSRHKKIISDLQKMSQSKLRDLVNNPRSGKLDFAMRELMKHHRAVLSKESRDVAEKMLPAEVLNPKPSELPHDDSSLLADFAIDWSSLPGELISTLGDLFQDLDSEAEDGTMGRELFGSTQSERDNYFNAVGISEASAANNSTTDDSTNLLKSVPSFATHEKVTPMDSDFAVLESRHGHEEILPKNVTSSPPVRIRVRQFAREKKFDSEENNAIKTDSTNAGHSNMNIVSTLATQELLKDKPPSEIVQDEGDKYPDATKFALPGFVSNESIEGNRGQDSSVLHFKDCRTQESSASHLITPREGMSCRSSHSDKIEFDSCTQQTGYEPHCGDSSVSPGKGTVGKETTVACENSLSSEKDRESKKQRGGKKRNKQRHLVRLEERSWFQKSPPPEMSSTHQSDGSISKNCANIATNHTDGESSHSVVPNVLSVMEDNSGLTTEQPEVSCVSNETYGRNSAREVSNVTNDDGNLASGLLRDRLDASMIPELMMTFAPSSSSETVSNVTAMTAFEIQQRIKEIDAQLQNLVQERFLLSQALIVKQSDNISSVAESPSPEESDNASHVKSLPDSQSGTNENCSVSDTSRSSKRKAREPMPDDKRLPKKMKLKDKTVTTQTSEIPKAVCSNEVVDKSIRDCYVRLESISPNTLLEKVKKNSEVIVIDGENVYKDINGTKSSITHCSAPFSWTFAGIEGTILDLKAVKFEKVKGFFAASQDGCVYLVSHATRQVLAVFGEKKTSAITCMDLLHYGGKLYTGSRDGVLSIYNFKSSPICTEPIATFNISNGIHCIEINWNYVYIGTKTGCVIPFNLSTSKAGEPLNIGGYPILSIKTCTEGPRRVLVVASRNQPIAIRDAMSGLLLRSFGGCDWTVYSIQLQQNHVFCGTSSDQISVFDFQSGEKVYELKAGKGVVHMTFFNGLLFCACYDGKIYVFDPVERKTVVSFDGPGKMALCLSVSKRKVVCSSKDKPLTCYPFPQVLLQYLKWYNNKKKALSFKVKEKRKEAAKRNEEESRKKDKKGIKQ